MLKIFKTEESLSKEVAKEMKSQVESLDNPVFCLASGSTPQKIYKVFSESSIDDKDLEKLKFVGLDEWVNVSKDIDGSCYQMLNKDLFKRINLKDEQIVFFETVDTDLAAECKRIDEFISNNPMTFTLMGVGMNGHIGLNEPGDLIKDCSSVVNLSDKTKEVAQKYFEKGQVLEQGITLGLQQILEAKRTIVVITGEHKKHIVKEIFVNKSANLPAQSLLGFEHIDFYIDESAAELLLEENGVVYEEV